MLRLVCTFVLAALPIFCVQAQKKTALKGAVADSTSKDPMERATIAVQHSKDSSLITYALTDNKGAFNLAGIPADKSVRVIVSYTGYRSFTRTFSLNSDSTLGTIYLVPAVTELNAIVVAAERPPVSIRKDTIEFNAGSFQTRPYAVVGDLLKKLPGVDVDENGAITVNGKKVSRILVDGQEFFGNSTTMATQNLPVDIIDKVQVMDTKTRVEARMGIEKDGENRTINLTLKADKKVGVFGKITAGGGTDGRYELNGMFNGFSGPKQFSAMGFSNNNGGQLMSMGGSRSGDMGIAGMDMGGGGGINTSHSGGINYNDRWNDMIMNSNYMVNNSNNRTRSQSNREALNADGRLLTNNNRSGYNRMSGHSLGVSFDIPVDSSFTINVNPSINYSNMSGNNTGTETTRREDGSLVNTNETVNRMTGTNMSVSNGINLSKFLGKKGRFIMVNFNQSYGSDKSKAYNINNVDYYENGVISDTRRMDQLTVSDNNNSSYSGNITYAEPLSEKWRLNLGYGVSYNTTSSNRQTFNYDAAKQEYSDLDDTYTNKFRTVNSTQTPSTTVEYNGEKLSGSVGASMHLNVLENYSYTTDKTLLQRQQNFSPMARVSYRFKNSGSLNLGYHAMMQQPSLEDLQPVPDNTNTLDRRIGNPDLKASFSQGINVNYLAYTPNLATNITVSFSPVMNRISTASFVNARGERTTQAINVDGTYSYNVHFNVSKMKQRSSTSRNTYRVTLGGMVTGSKNISFSNTGNAAGDTTLYRNIVINTMYAPTFTIGYNIRDLFEAGINYRPSFNDSRYKPNNIPQGTYFMHNATAGISLFWPKNFTWDNSLNYRYNSRITPGFRKDVMLWNTSVAYRYKTLEFKLFAFDLLHQNTSVQRIVTEQFVEDTQSDIVDQYFMLAVSWNFNRFNGKRMAPPKTMQPVIQAF